MGWHSLRTPEKQWSSQPSHVSCVVDFRRIDSGLEKSVSKLSFLKSKLLGVFAADGDERLGLVTCENPSLQGLTKKKEQRSRSRRTGCERMKKSVEKCVETTMDIKVR